MQHEPNAGWLHMWRQLTSDGDAFAMTEWPVVSVSHNALPIPVGPPGVKHRRRCVRIYATCPWLQKIHLGMATHQKHEADYTRAVIVNLRALTNAARNKDAVIVEATSEHANRTETTQ